MVNSLGDFLDANYKGDRASLAGLVSRSQADNPKKQKAPRKKIERGFCILRTRGNRLELLSESLVSVKLQSVEIICCVVVHANEGAFDLVSSWVHDVDPNAVLIHAHDLEKKRGYPINLALDYLRTHFDQFDFFFFLDDDDILYPFYSQRLVSVLELTGADIALGLANQRVPWNPPELVHRAKPAAALVAGNFIPINSYIVRREILLTSGARAREDMDYLEDWDFLLSLFSFGAKFHYLPEIVCEYRVIEDGNRNIRRDPEHYDECNERVKVRGMDAARKLKYHRFFADLMDFNFREPEARDSEFAHIKMALSVFDLAAENEVG